MHPNPIIYVYVYLWVNTLFIYKQTYLILGLHCTVYIYACDLVQNLPFSSWPCYNRCPVPNHAPNIYAHHDLMPFSGSSLILWSSELQGRKT